MEATVTHLNPKLGYYSATTDRNKIVFTLPEPAVIKLGDILEGDVNSPGVRSMHNKTRDFQFNIDVQAIYKLSAPFIGHG